MQGSRYTSLLLLAPAAVLFALLTIYPLGRGLLLSFFVTDYGFEGATFVGTENFSYLLGDSFFRRATWNTVFFTLMATVSEVGLGLRQRDADHLAPVVPGGVDRHRPPPAPDVEEALARPEPELGGDQLVLLLLGELE